MAEVDGGLTLFSVQDLFGYLYAHPTMSGIQRVQAGISVYAIEHDIPNVRFILNDLTSAHRDGEFLLIDSNVYLKIINYASGEHVVHEKLRKMLTSCQDEAIRYRPSRRDTIIILGAFWGNGNTVDRYLTVRREGVKVGGYVHDIIPVSHPEYCDPALVRDFVLALGDFLVVVDFVFTVSDFTGQTLRNLLAEVGHRDIAIRTVPLAHSLTTTREAESEWPMALRRLKNRPYVAYVSTIEGRKNHLYLVLAWRQLIAEGVDVPDLVFVGRYGWRINGLIDLLEGTDYLDGRVHFLHDLSDAELETVYANCQFTVFTSFIEGWGLPVGESLVHGVPCVASRSSSIPEVGGDFVDYVDPLSVREGVAVLRRMIEDKAYRDARRRAIETSFVPRTWNDVGRDFIAKAHEAMALDYPAREFSPLLDEARCFRIGELSTASGKVLDYLRCPVRLALVGSFYDLESHGAWMQGNVGKVTFRTAVPEGEEIVVYLEMSAAPTGVGQLLSVYFEDQGNSEPSQLATSRLAQSRPTLLRVRGKAGRAGGCTVLIDVTGDGAQPGGDSRNFLVGLSAIGYARTNDAALREDLAEHFLFHDLTS